jgi:ABC-type lipoprotein release transport system permease subunit
LRDALSVVALGAAIGWLVALPAGSVVASFLSGVLPHDPLTLIAVPLFLLATALLASVLPALRAARVEPGESLR